MARDTSGSQNQPQYAGTGVPADAADLSELGNYAAFVGNKKVGPTTGTATGPGNANTGRTTSTGADVWEGLDWWDTTLKRLFRYTSSAWSDTSVLPHVEYLFSRAGIGDAGDTGGSVTVFSQSVDAGNTTDSAFTTNLGNNQLGQVTVNQAGIYSVDFYAQVAAAPTGVFAATIVLVGGSPNTIQAKTASPSGQNTLSTSLSNIKLASGAQLQFQVQKTTGGAADVSCRIRITKISN
jgi:hypothetical protein